MYKKTNYKTDQEDFWSGEFGTNYITRNQSEDLLAANLFFFSNALKNANKIKSCIEFGANIGMNLKALKMLYPKIQLNGIEINQKAARELSDLIGEDNVFLESILNWDSKKVVDLSLIKGVLIHLNPDVLKIAYKKIYEASSRYILICEYYNTKPVSISYRGHEKRLFKRDFAGEMLDLYPSLKLLDYGFSYHRDTSFPQDDITWYLLSK